jgi:DNA polymerase V
LEYWNIGKAIQQFSNLIVMFALVDCNNFYVSCERVFNPSLHGKPVIVLSNNDGCIISRSEEAKNLGLKMAEPAFQKKKFLEENHVRTFSSNYELYGDMSQRVIETLRQFSPEIEIYSIDECFIDLKGTPEKDLHKIALTLKNSVLKNTGIPVSIGISSTKTLAKTAGKAAKKLDGIFVVENENHRDTLLRNTPIDSIWGIGRQHFARLAKAGIKTAHDFTLLHDEWIRKYMTVTGLRIKKELLGISCLTSTRVQSPKKAIATTRAFGKKTDNIEFLREAVATYAVRCCEKLRKQKSVANIITVFIHTDPFNKNEKQYSVSKTIALPGGSNNNISLVGYSLKALDLIYKKGYFFKKAGVIAEGICPDTGIQLDLLSDQCLKESNRLTEIVDKINLKFGRDKIKLAVQGSGEEWKLRQEKLSQKYTTKIEDVIQLNCKEK